MVTMLPSAGRERLRQKPNTLGMQRDPSKASGLQRLLVLEADPFKEILTQPQGQSGEAHLLDGFHLLIQEVVFQEVRKR